MKIPTLIAVLILFIQPIALNGMDANPILSEDFFVLNIQLQNAIEAGDAQIIAFYLAQGGDVELKIKPKQAPLLVHACRHNNSEICKLLLDAHANPNSIDKKSKTPLMCANDEKICKMLLDAKAEVHATDAYGNTPLMLASNEYICKMLLDAGAVVNASNDSGRTPLMTAIDGKITKLLLEAKAEVNALNSDGMNALFECESSEKCRFLLQAKADVHARNSYGETPLFDCADHYSDTDENMAIHKNTMLEIYRLLLDAKADINAQCNEGYTVLLQEMQNKNERACKLLLSRGASVHLTTNNGTIPLIVAAKLRKKAICKMLVNHHKELDRGLLTALHCLKYIKNPFLRFLYSERNTLLRPYLQQHTLQALLMQTDQDGKRPYHLFSIHCLEPKKLQFSDEDSAYDSEDGNKNSSSRKNELFGRPWNTEKIWRCILPEYPNKDSE